MIRYLIVLSFNFFLKLRNIIQKCRNVYKVTDNIYSAVWILVIGLQDVRTIATITWEVFSKSRGILTRIKEK